MAEPRRATLAASTGTIQWSDATNFNGYIWIGVAMPTISGTAYAKVMTDNDSPALRLPRYYRIPVIDGVIDSSAKLYYTADLVPPNTRYKAYYFDTTGTQIAEAAGLFSVSSTPHTLTIPTLTVPTTAVTAPTPET